MLATRPLGFVAAILVVALPNCSPAQPQADVQRPSLGALIDQLSEPGGYFDTDNLISNERSFVQVMDRLEPAGGAYLGVGPEQNFNYIARRRPEWAFIVDIRRDNLLEVLLLEAVLLRAESPGDYLCWLLSRACGPGREAGIEDALRRLEQAEPSPELQRQRADRLVRTIADDLGVELRDGERERVRAIHRAFFDGQLDLRFRSHGRRLQLHYPTYEDLLLAQTPAGKAASFLASTQDYAFVRELARSGRLVPVVGNFAGNGALRRIAAVLREHGVEVTTFYTSNVEYYLYGNGTFDAWVENLRSLPIADEALFVRACFGYGRRHPQNLPGLRSTTVLQPIGRFLELWTTQQLRDYWDVCIRAYLE